MLEIGAELNQRWIYESALNIAKTQNSRHVWTPAERLFAAIWSHGVEFDAYRCRTSALNLTLSVLT